MNGLPAPSNIPLHCKICPKRPDFSDVSHLLTHVASKAHLSNYFKAQVQGDHDPEAKTSIEEYDKWYSTWNLQELMRERLSQKEKRKFGAQPSLVHRAVTASIGHRHAANTTFGQRRTRARAGELDPQLEHKTRLTDLSRSVTPIASARLRGASRSRNPYPALRGWSSQTPYDNSPFKQESVISTPSFEDDGDFDMDGPDLGSSFDSTSTQALMFPPYRPRSFMCNSMDPAVAVDHEYGIEETITDSSRMKGIYWPGMAMFDSATPEMKRKRNQKKGFQVLRNLQLTSEIVEPTECVFDTSGILRKRRKITGNPESEEDLIEGESSPEPEPAQKRRSRRRNRAVLAVKDSNGGRQGSRRHRASRSLLEAASYFDGSEDIENTVPYGPARINGQASRKIHRDNSGPEISFDNPVPFSFLTAPMRAPTGPTLSEHQDDGLFQPSFRQATNSNLGTCVHSRQDSWGDFSGSFRPSAQTDGNVMLPDFSNYGNFARYLSQSMTQPINLAAPHVNHTAATLPQGYACAMPRSYPNENNAHAAAAHHVNTWDFLAMGNSFDMNVLGSADSGFASMSGDLSSANSMMFPHHRMAEEAHETNANPSYDPDVDDAATVSADSEH